MEAETLGPPHKVTGQLAEEAGRSPPPQVDRSHNRRVVTRRTMTPTGMEGNAKTMPLILEDRCGTTSLAPSTPWTRKQSRRRTPHPNVDASKHRCRIGAGDPNRKPRREDGSAPSMKRDPPYRPGQWHRQRGMNRLVRPERQQMPLQRAHAKTTGQNKSLQRSQVPKSTCQAERVGRQSNKKLPATGDSGRGNRIGDTPLGNPS